MNFEITECGWSVVLIWLSLVKVGMNLITFVGFWFFPWHKLLASENFMPILWSFCLNLGSIYIWWCSQYSVPCLKMLHNIKMSCSLSSKFNKSTGCLKKTHLKEMCDFFNPKNVTFCSSVDQTKRLPSLWPNGKKIPFFNWEIVSSH